MRRIGQFLSLLLILTAGVLWVSQASGANGSNVTIRTVDDGPKHVDLNDIPTLGNQKIKVRDSDGKKLKPVTINKQNPGWSLASIYEEARIDDYSKIGFVEIARADGGGFVRLTGKQLQPGYFDGQGAAVYRKGVNGSLRFIRPLFPGIKSDFNSSDSFELDGTLTLRDRTGSPLAVEVTATPEKPKAGESVSFKASVTGGEGLTLNYKWSFSDGTESDVDSDTVPHTFDSPNAPVSAVVTVTTEHDDSKGEGAIALNVGKEEKDEDTSSSSGGYDYSDGYSGYSSGYTTPSYTDPGTDYSLPDDATPEADPSEAEKEAEVAQTEPTGTPVTGELLQDAAVVEGTAAPPVDDSSVDQPEPTTPVPTVESEQDVPTTVVTGMAIVGLLGFGTFTELGTSGSGRRRRLIPVGRGKK